jgi:hypothetical protein
MASARIGRLDDDGDKRERGHDGRHAQSFADRSISRHAPSFSTRP